MTDGQTIFELKPDVTAVADGTGCGLRRGKALRYAKNDVQRAVLQALYRGRATQDALLQVIAGQEHPGTPESSDALLLADFILDFDIYLKPHP